MPKKTAECPTCGAPLPILRGEILSCPECGMPVETREYFEEETQEGEETEETEEEEE